jgi:ATP-dependent DNA helicase RecG
LPGLCLLVTNAEPESAAMERLYAVASTTDGFALSRIDLEQRREGDVLGASQSGFRSGLRRLSVIRDEDTIVEARTEAELLLAADPTLASLPALAEAVEGLETSRQGDFMEKA